MWPLPTIRNEWVSCRLTPHEISLSWIRRIKGAAAPYELAAFAATPLNNLELEHLVLRNKTHLCKIIDSFLSSHALNNAYITCALAGHAMYETIVDLSTASPTPAHFADPALKKMVWDYQYLYAKDDAHYSFYVCGLQRHHLFQYQLLAMDARMNMMIMTTEQMALLRVYKQIYGAAFRHAQFGRDMIKAENNLDQFFTPHIIRRILHIPATRNVQSTHMPTLSKHLGLFLLGQDTYEKH